MNNIDKLTNLKISVYVYYTLFKHVNMLSVPMATIINIRIYFAINFYWIG